MVFFTPGVAPSDSFSGVAASVAGSTSSPSFVCTVWSKTNDTGWSLIRSVPSRARPAGNTPPAPVPVIAIVPGVLVPGMASTAPSAIVPSWHERHSFE